MVNLIWHFRKLEPPRPLQGSSVADRIALFRETKRLGHITRVRASSKQEKDQDRLTQRLERQRLFQEAYVDQGFGPNGSVGEVDSRSTSKLLDVEPGDVLRDPKLRYQHPSLRYW